MRMMVVSSQACLMREYALFGHDRMTGRWGAFYAMDMSTAEKGAERDISARRYTDICVVWRSSFTCRNERAGATDGVPDIFSRLFARIFMHAL